MSVMEARLGGRRVAARNAAERRKKIILASLIVLFVALMAFQLPKLLKGSESSTPAPVAVSAAPATAGAGSVPAVASAPVRSSARVHAIRRMSARDPFVPLIRENAATASAAPATSSPRVRRAVRAAVPTRVVPLRGVVRAVKPTAAVLVVNGRRQVVGVREAFGFGDATFRVVSVGRKTMRLQVSGGSFGAGKQTITVRKGHGVKLVNTATGESFSIRFSAPTTKS